MPSRALRPVREPAAYYDRIDDAIREAFMDLVYRPLIKEIGISAKRMANAARQIALIEAIEKGTITYDDSGRFRGRFNAAVVIDLRDLGARFDRKTSSYFLSTQNLPVEIKEAIRLSEGKFLKKLHAIDEKLRQKLPAEIAGAVKTAKIFDSTLFHVDRELGKTLQDVTVLPQLTAAQRKQIADEWQNNLELSIKDFADREISQLRKDIQASAFEGNRYESLIKSIQRSYGVTKSKATFLARQETSLLVAKFKEVRYRDAGVNRYRWKCVAGSAAHPVRPSHKVLDGTEHTWDQPPITTAVGEPPRRNHPGEDFNCFAGSTMIGQFHDIIAAVRRRYPNKLAFAVTHSGSRIESTPNHPVLTNAGWKALQDLQVGDYLVKAKPQASLFGEIDKEHAETTIEQIFGLWSIVADVFGGEGHTSQFHGDGSAEEVDVITIDRSLPSEVDLLCAKACFKCLLAVADEVIVGLGFAGSRDLAARIAGMGLTADSPMGRIGQLLALLRGKSGHSYAVRLGAASRLDAVLNETSANGQSLNSILFGDRQFTGPDLILREDFPNWKFAAVVCLALDVSGVSSPCADMLGENVSAAFQASSDLREMNAGVKEFDCVVDKGVCEQAFGHYVYNLETRRGWYSAQGFAVHNCRCVAIPLVDFKQ